MGILETTILMLSLSSEEFHNVEHIVYTVYALHLIIVDHRKLHSINFT